MYWANFLHIYQPPTQKEHWVRKITEESYQKIFNGLKNYSKAKLTLNINGVLVEFFDKYGRNDVIDSIRFLIKNGQLELTGSAKYHPLLPFLPDEESIRQIKLNEETLKYYFGSDLKLRGFFPPEMGFSKHVAEIANSLGYEWIIADELSFDRSKGQVKYDRVYKIKDLDSFYIFFRERRMSWIILSGQVGTGDLLIKSLGDRLNNKEFLLTAMDGETFGHHRPGLEQLLFEIYESPFIETTHISTLPSLFGDVEEVDPFPSTWALMEKDLEIKKPFSRWNDPGNEIHVLQWRLTRLAIEAINKIPSTHPGFPESRAGLDRALHSDQYWWASARPWWSIEMIERGAKELYDVVANSPAASQEGKSEAKDLYHKIVFTAFDWQRSGLVDELARAEDEEIRQRTDVGMPKLLKAEIEKMTANLKIELESMVQSQEFERAAQIRDRIKELESYADEKQGRAFAF